MCGGVTVTTWILCHLGVLILDRARVVTGCAGQFSKCS
jgi:hypothetical protein